MAKRRPSQIDPFNAGEPELPWELPSNDPARNGFDDGHVCELPEEGYESPVKRPDNYDAPDTTEEMPARRRPRRNGKPGSPKPPSKPNPRGKKKRGCVTMFIILIAMLSVLGTLGSCISEAVYDLTSNLSSPFDAFDDYDDADDYDYSYEYEYDSDELDADEQAVEQATVDTLEALDEPGGTAETSIADYFASDFEDVTGYTVDDAGIDPTDYAIWALHSSDYQIHDVYAFSAIGEDDEATGSAYFDAELPDVYALRDDFYAEVVAYLDDNDLSASSHAELGVDDRAAIQDLFADALDRHADSTHTVEYAGLDFTQHDGDWIPDEESYDNMLAYLFSLYY